MTRKVLILGGCGFIGRNLVKYLLEKNLVDKLRVADKKIPEMAGLSKNFSTAFEDPRVEFIQANLIIPEQIAKVFNTDGAPPFDIVINLAAETRLSLEEQAYKEGIEILAVHCAKEAVKHKVQKFIHVSTGFVYEASSTPKNENGKVSPFSFLTIASLQTERELQKIPNLNLVIVRPAIVYGPGDTGNIGCRISVAAIYKKLGKVMKLPWGPDWKINTVHVHDLARALWFLVEKGEVGKVYNIADKGDTDQGKLNAILSDIFGVKIGYKNKATFAIAAKISMAAVTEEVNSRHIDPWAQICRENNLPYSKLSPYLDSEMLENKDCAIDGSAIEKLGFVYEKPNVTEQLIRETVDDYIVAEWFPKNFL